MNLPATARKCGVPWIVRGAAVAFGLLAFCACQQQTSVYDAGPAPTEEPLKLEKVFDTALHRAHMDAPVPTSCTDCHRIGDDPTRSSLSARCATCHEQRMSPVHADVAIEEGRECLLCHDFLSQRGEPATCQGCHTSAGAGEGLPPFAGAPQIVQHEEETCSECHRTHGEPTMDVRPCRECHDKVVLAHQDVLLPDPEQCTECHRSHQPPRQARARCAECHRVQKASGATFPGHDECVTCHRPHPERASMSGVKACGDCHTQKARSAPEHHKRCRSCHAQHRVADSPQGACARCHSDLQSDHPRVKGKGACLGCHSIHPSTVAGQASSTLTSCTACHDVAKAQKDLHAAGRTACRDCHRPHGFALDASDPNTCLRCHRGSQLGTVQAAGRSAALAKGHERCVGCHQTAAHAPQDPPKACAACHAQQAGSAPEGHAECLGCHTPHDGKVAHRCVDCHQDRGRGFHAKPASQCNRCHRPHGPTGPSQPLECRSCHDRKLPGLHVIKEHARCQDCHTFHGQTLQVPPRSTCLASCHQQQVDTKHEPEAKSCVGCHMFVE